MSKIGVKRIMGEHAPKTGQKVVYSVVEWYPETPVMMRDVKQVTWELFKKRANGEYTSTNIKKIGIGEFTFHEGAYGNEYMVEGYLKTPEKKGDTVILITPQVGPPSLIKIELLDSNHKLLKEGTLHYGQTLVARVHCTNMMGKPVEITLLEDDEPGAGHNEKNNRNVMDSQTVTVDRNGVAEATFLLSPAYIIKANKYGDGNTDKQHEYYVLAECENQQKASRNTNVDNPTYKPPVKTIPEIATEKVQNFLKEKLNVLRDILHDPTPPTTKNKVVVELKEEKKEEEKKEIENQQLFFPLVIKPLNIKENKHFQEQDYEGAVGSTMGSFKYPRNKGNRLHAARDLYTPPLAEIYAMTSGIVIDISQYYCSTWQITIQHDYEYIKGYKLVVRYGEVDSKSIKVKVGDKVQPHQIIAHTGKLIKQGKPLLIINHTIIYMLHLEMYTGKLGPKPELNTQHINGHNKFMRREDLFDPLQLLQQAFKNSQQKGYIK